MERRSRLCPATRYLASELVQFGAGHPLSAPDRQTPGRPRRLLDRSAYGKQECFGTRTPNGPETHGEPVGQAHRGGGNGPAGNGWGHRDRTNAGHVVVAKGEVALPCRTVGGGNQHIGMGEGRLEARAQSPFEVPGPGRSIGVCTGTAQLERSYEQVVAEMDQLRGGVPLLVGDDLGQVLGPSAPRVGRYAASPSTNSQSRTVSSSSFSTEDGNATSTSWTSAPAAATRPTASANSSSVPGCPVSQA